MFSRQLKCEYLENFPEKIGRDADLRIIAPRCQFWEWIMWPRVSLPKFLEHAEQQQ